MCSSPDERSEDPGPQARKPSPEGGAAHERKHKNSHPLQSGPVMHRPQACHRGLAWTRAVRTSGCKPASRARRAERRLSANQNDDTHLRFGSIRGGFEPFQAVSPRLFIIDSPRKPLNRRKTRRFGAENVIICRHFPNFRPTRTNRAGHFFLFTVAKNAIGILSYISRI